MKTSIKVVAVIFFLIALAYFGQAQKANRVSEIRIKAKYEKGEMSQTEYENLKKQNTLIKTLFSPKEVLSVD